MANMLAGQIGFAKDFEERTGRYIIDFTEGVGIRKEFALHPMQIFPVEDEKSWCGEGEEPKKKPKKKKKDEL